MVSPMFNVSDCCPTQSRTLAQLVADYWASANRGVVRESLTPIWVEIGHLENTSDNLSDWDIQAIRAVDQHFAAMADEPEQFTVPNPERFTVAYTIFTDDSDVAESGYYEPHFYHCDEPHLWELRELVSRFRGVYWEPSEWPVYADRLPRWVSCCDSHGLASDGLHSEQISLFRPDNITDASWARVLTVLGVKVFD